MTWRHEIDSATGTSFELPGTVTTSKQSASGPQGQSYQVRLYTGQLNNNLGCSASVETSLSGQLYALQPSKAPQVYVSRFQAAGSKDAAASDVRSVSVDGHAGVHFLLTFTGGDGAHVRWFVELINTATSQVILQTFSSDAATSAGELGQLDHRLTGSLRVR